VRVALLSVEYAVEFKETLEENDDFRRFNVRPAPAGVAKMNESPEVRMAVDGSEMKSPKVTNRLGLSPLASLWGLAASICVRLRPWRLAANKRRWNR
jgi:hypothetical protein